MRGEQGAISRANERRVAVEAILDQFNALHDLWLTDFEKHEHLGSVRVAAAVLIGHTSRRPMTMQDIADYLHMPRTSVRGRLEVLLDTGVCRREGDRYFMNERRANSPLVMRKVALIVARQAVAGRVIQAAVNTDAWAWGSVLDVTESAETSLCPWAESSQ
jgi:IclR helix-turn-helix domain